MKLHWQCSKKNQCQYWFKKFRNGNFDIKSASDQGDPSRLTIIKLWHWLNQTHFISSDTLLKHQTLVNKCALATNWVRNQTQYLISSGTQRSSFDVLIVLTPAICYWKNQENDLLLKRMIAGVKKCIVYKNVQQKRFGPNMKRTFIKGIFWSQNRGIGRV